MGMGSHSWLCHCINCRHFCHWKAVGGDSQHQLLSFGNVPYLTPKQAIGFGLLHDAGNFAASLWVHGDRLQGTVKNNTKFPLDSAFIEIGLQRIPIGSIKKGEEKQIDSKLESLFMPRHQNQDDLDTRQERMKQLQEDVLMYGKENQVRIIGMNTEPLPLLRMRMPHRALYWNVVSQPIRLRADQQGIITYPYGLLEVNVQEATGDYDTKSAYLLELGKGSAVFELKVGEAQVSLKRIIVPLDHSSFRPFQTEVFHQKTGKWKQLGRGERLVLDHDLLEYLTSKETILLRFSHNGKQRMTLPTPFFQVEGSGRTW